MEIKEFFKQKDPSGKYKNENYIKNNYNDYYNIVINFSIKNNLNDLPFKQKVYHFVHDIKNIIVCPVCNNKVNFRNFTIGYNKYCSKKCISKSKEVKQKKKENSLKKYGTTCPQKSKEVKEKMIKTNQKKYGSNCPLQNKEIEKKSKETLNKNYNVDHPAKSKEIQEKRIKNFNVEKWKNNFNKSMINKYGTKIALQNNEIKEKMFKTNMNKYGTKTPLQNEEIKEKMIKTVKEKYNTDCVLKNPEIMEKSKKTLKEKYNVDNVFKLKEIQERIEETNIVKYGFNKPLKNEKIKEKMIETLKSTYKHKMQNSHLNFVNYDFDEKIFTIYCERCNNNFEIESSLYNNRKQHNTTICTKCNPINSSKSGLELQVLNFIKDNYSGKIEHNSRSIINPYELDIYIPDLKLAIEFNGLYWHNELKKPNNYHKIKSDLCNIQGIKLIHIWEDDWNYKKDIVKFIILNNLKEKIKVKKHNIKLLDDCKDFLNLNHIEGYIKCDISLGLFQEEKLISLLCLNKNNKDWELVRFYDRNGLKILFDYFKKNYEINKVNLILDRSYNDYNDFINIGFKIKNILKPNYNFIINNIRTNSNLNKENNLKIYNAGKIEMLF